MQCRPPRLLTPVLELGTERKGKYEEEKEKKGKTEQEGGEGSIYMWKAVSGDSVGRQIDRRQNYCLPNKSRSKLGMKNGILIEVQRACTYLFSLPTCSGRYMEPAVTLETRAYLHVCMYVCMYVCT